LSNYNCEDLGQIKGHKTEEIAAILGACPYEVVIHRDNLVLTRDVS
jgi:glutamate 5-kinase